MPCWWRSAWDVAWWSSWSVVVIRAPRLSRRRSAGAEGGPGAGAGLDRVVLVGDHQGGDRGTVGAVVHDREQVTLGEPSRGRGDTQRGVDRFGADQGGQLERGGHLRPDPLRADGGGLDQPRVRTGPEREERLLLACCGPWAAAASGDPSGCWGWSG